MEKKYINQPNNFTCGSVSVYNLLVWLDQPIKRKDLKEITLFCKTNSKYGVWVEDLNRAIKKYTKNIAKFRRIKYKKVEQSKKFLNNGGALIILFFQGTNSHYGLFIKEEKHLFIINVGMNVRLEITKKELENVIDNSFTQIWAVKKIT